MENLGNLENVSIPVPLEIPVPGTIPVPVAVPAKSRHFLPIPAPAEKAIPVDPWSEETAIAADSMADLLLRCPCDTTIQCNVKINIKGCMYGH